MNIDLGTFYGEHIILEDTSNLYTEKEWQNKWENYIEGIKKSAIDSYKTELFLKDLKDYKKRVKKWYNVF